MNSFTTKEPRVTKAYEEGLVRRGFADLLHDDGHVNQSRLHDLHQRIGHVYVGAEGGAAGSAAGVDRVGGCGVNLLHVMARAGDRDSRRIDFDARYVFSDQKVSGDTGMDLDLAREACIEGQMHLAGNNLHHCKVPRMTNLL